MRLRTLFGKHSGAFDTRRPRTVIFSARRNDTRPDTGFDRSIRGKTQNDLALFSAGPFVREPHRRPGLRRGGTDKSVVLVHGAFVDGSGWERVYQILKKDGYDVTVVQNPTELLAGDVAATRAVLDAQTKPVILVGHSYGGVVITEAGNHPNVAGLVYVAPSRRTPGSWWAS